MKRSFALFVTGVLLAASAVQLTPDQTPANASIPSSVVTLGNGFFATDPDADFVVNGDSDSDNEASVDDQTPEVPAPEAPADESEDSAENPVSSSEQPNAPEQDLDAGHDPASEEEPASEPDPVPEVETESALAPTSEPTTEAGTGDTSEEEKPALESFENEPLVTVSGKPILGSKLTAKPGKWQPTPKLTYQWKRLKNKVSSNISGAKSATYIATKKDVGYQIFVVVTANLEGYQKASVKSSSTTVVLNKITNSVRPKITGTAKAGKTLTVKTGTWAPAKTTLKLRWQRDGTAIKGATKASYKLKTADRGHKITVKVTASKSGYATTTATSAAKTVLSVLKKGTPKVTGSSAKVGATITAATGSWTKGTKFTYQWYRDGKAIKGATKQKRKVVAADQCRALTVKVTGKKTHFETASKTSAKRNLVACAQASGDKIRLGQRIAPGKKIVSSNKAHHVQTETNGNFYLYNHGRERFGAVGKAKSQLVLLSNGNLVLRYGTKTQWSSKTSGKGVAYGRVLNNGDFGLFTSSGKQVWAVSKAWTYRGNNYHGVPRFSQNDSRWAGQWIGGRVFGPVGCVPTAFAMAAQSYGVRVDPGAVGRVMNQKGDFNHAQAGAGSKSIVAAANHYGVMATPLHSWNAVADALASNQPVIALVRGPAQITSPGSTHAVVLSGYSGGTTTVINPWGSMANQRWSVSTLWAWQSHDSLDRNAGAVFWAMG